MIWLTWRQFRAQAMLGSAALVVIAIILAITGPQLVHLYDSPIVNCAAHDDCGTADQALVSRYQFLQDLIGYAVIAVPGIIGVFWGAPLIARELEAGTFRLVWNQTVTRTQWTVIKLGLTALASMVTAGLLSLMVTWWFSPIDRVNMNRLLPGTFAERGITPIGYAAFAFVLGVTVGLLVRRAIPAMGITLAIFVAIQIIVPLWIRPNLLPAVHADVPLNAAALSSATSAQFPGSGPFSVGLTIPGAWVLSTSPVINSHGRVADDIGATCTGGAHSPGAGSSINTCIAKLNLRVPITYQPASRYWPLQWYETGIFLGLALLMAGFCFWWVRRRLT